MQGSFNPFASPAVLIDKMIGNAYSIVEFVARNMNHIRRCSLYMRNIYDASQRMTTVVGVTGPLEAGLFVDIPLPTIFITTDTGGEMSRTLQPSHVNGWRITLKGKDEFIYDEFSGMFHGVILPTGFLRVALDPGATENFEGQPIKVLFDYSIPLA